MKNTPKGVFFFSGNGMIISSQLKTNHMKQIKDLLPKLVVVQSKEKIEVPKGERKRMLTLFCKRIQADQRAENKILEKQMLHTHEVFSDQTICAGFLGHVKTWELKPFYDECARSDNFKKTFFGSLKVKKDKTVDNSSGQWGEW